MFQHKRTSILSSPGLGKAYFLTSTNPKVMSDFCCFAMYCQDYYKIYIPPILCVVYMGICWMLEKGLTLSFW